MNWDKIMYILTGLIIIALIVLIIVAVTQKNYHIFVENCENQTLMCDKMIETDFMYWTENNTIYYPDDLNKNFLNKECNLLTKNAWACNKYLVQIY